MSLYTFLLFAHILGVLGLFIGMGLQWISILRLRRASTVRQAREWIGLARGAGRLGPVMGALVIGTGIAMMVMRWGLTTPWIMVSLAAIAVMMAAGMGVAARRMKAAGRALAGSDDDSLTPEQRRRTNDPALWVATQLAASLALGVVFMMTIKPDLGGSLLTLAVTLVVGAAAGGAKAKPRRGFEGETSGGDIANTTAAPHLPMAGSAQGR